MGIEEKEHHHHIKNGNGRLLIDENDIGHKKGMFTSDSQKCVDINTQQTSVLV